MSAHEINEYLTNRADHEIELVKVNELNDHELNDRELNDHELNESSSSLVQPELRPALQAWSLRSERRC